jgi:hypothetical protein
MEEVEAPVSPDEFAAELFIRGFSGIGNGG